MGIWEYLGYGKEEKKPQSAIDKLRENAAYYTRVFYSGFLAGISINTGALIANGPSSISAFLNSTAFKDFAIGVTVGTLAYVTGTMITDYLEAGFQEFFIRAGVTGAIQGPVMYLINGNNPLVWFFIGMTTSLSADVIYYIGTVMEYLGGLVK